jgi:hypothetical protein
MTEQEQRELEVRIKEEGSQLTFYQCETPSCPHYHIPKQIREFINGNPVYPPAVLCDGADGCGEEWVRMKDATIQE